MLKLRIDIYGVYDKAGLTGRRPFTWTEFAKAHSAAFKQG